MVTQEKMFPSLTRWSLEEVGRYLIREKIDVTGQIAIKPEEMVFDHILRLAEESPPNRERLPETRAQWMKQREYLKKKLRKSLDLYPFPHKTPLRAKITGEIDRSDYLIQKLIFESRPNFFVTALVYVPKNNALPAPAIICPSGHWGGKHHPIVQSRMIGLAKRGYIALTYDPVGDGERDVKYNNHRYAGSQALLVGNSVLGFMVWDSIRAIDYLCTREDVDSTRIGCTGASGGGLNTVCTSALDERIRVAVPVCYIHTYEGFMKTRFYHCLCNHIPNILKYADMPDICSLIAPRPLLIINGYYDWRYPMCSVGDAYNKIKRIYGFFGLEKIAMITTLSGHGYDGMMREAMYMWYNKWFMGENDPEYAKEPPDRCSNMIERKETLNCFNKGSYPSRGSTIVSINRKSLKNICALSAFKNEEEYRSYRANLLRAIKRILGFYPRRKCPLDVTTLHITEKDSYVVEEVVFRTERDVVIWGSVFRPRNLSGSAPGILYVRQKGNLAEKTGKKKKSEPTYGRNYSKASSSYEDHIEFLVKSGYIVLVPDCRGTGKTYPKNIYWKSENYVASADSILLGRHIFGMRVWDLIRSLDYLQHRKDVDKLKIACLGQWTEGGLLALYTTALDTRITAIALDKPLISYKSIIETGAAPPLDIAIPGILKCGDLAQISTLIAPRKMLLLNVVDGENVGVSRQELHQEYDWTKKIYMLTDSKDNLVLEIHDSLDARRTEIYHCLQS